MNSQTIYFQVHASREAEIAGIKGALVGSILTMLICLSIAFPWEL